MKKTLSKIIGIIGIIIAILHMTYFALKPYNITYFFLILGIIYLFIPLTKFFNKNT